MMARSREIDAIAIKLAKICGMFGSDHGGERAAAALQADRLVRTAGLTWPDLLRPSLPHHFYSDYAPQSSGPQPLTPADLLRRHSAKLTPWERNFLSSLASHCRNRSPKQQRILNDITERVTGGGV